VRDGAFLKRPRKRLPTSRSPHLLMTFFVVRLPDGEGVIVRAIIV
jgi:hypothetical protein